MTMLNANDVKCARTGKTAFNTEGAAKHRASLLMRQYGHGQLRPYVCNHCSKIHLSAQEKGKRW